MNTIEELQQRIDDVRKLIQERIGMARALQRFPTTDKNAANAIIHALTEVLAALDAPSDEGDQ